MSDPRVQPFDIAAGASIMIGKPARPIAAEHTDRLARAVALVAGIREAHLPQVFIPGVSEQPGQALVLVLEPGANPDQVMAQLGPLIRDIVPSGIYLDVWPLPSSHELLGPVRDAGCLLFERPRAERTWWRFWAR